MKVDQLRKLEKNASREGKRFALQTKGAREKLLLISKLEGKYVQRGMVETMGKRRKINKKKPKELEGRKPVSWFPGHTNDFHM
jgi:hypothetical protein